MSGKLFFSFLILGIYFTKNVESVKMKYMDIIEKFQEIESLNKLTNSNTTLCGIHLAEYANSLRMEQYWALKMYDSSAKLPNSLLMGNRRILGNYDECIEVEHPERLFTGQHCTLSANITFDVDEGNPNKEAIDSYLERTPLSYGICVPSTCTAKDILDILSDLTNDTLSEMPLALDEENCGTKNPVRKLRLIDWIAIGIFIAFGVIAFSSTFFDIYQKFYRGNAKPHPLLISFSIYSNGQNLFRITKNSDHMKALDGMRVLTTCWVVLIHSRMNQGVPSINSFGRITGMSDINQIVATVGYIAVDTFFFLSGVLVCIVFFRNISKKGYYDVPMQYIHRYIRLTPSYAAIILITVSILIYMGDGPLWHSIHKMSIETCEKSWWSGLLYISTLYGSTHPCIGQTWYLSTDMQLYILSPLILLPLYLWPSFAKYILGIVILASACTTFSIDYFNDIQASLFRGLYGTNQFYVDYVKFYTRSSPYLIGLAMGYIISQIRVKNMTVKLKKEYVLAGWLISTGLCLSVIYGIMPFQRSKLPRFENALYLSLHRVAWGFGLAWIVFACLNGYGGPANKFLSWNLFQPLSKLSYNVYILHMTIQHYRLATSRTNNYYGNVDTTFGYLSDVMMSNLLAIPFTLLFEMPFGNLDTYFFRNVKILPFPKQKKIYELEQQVEKSDSSVENDNNNEKESASERF